VEVQFDLVMRATPTTARVAVLCAAFVGHVRGYRSIGASFGTAMKSCYQNGTECGEIVTFTCRWHHACILHHASAPCDMHSFWPCAQCTALTNRVAQRICVSFKTDTSSLSYSATLLVALCRIRMHHFTHVRYHTCACAAHCAHHGTPMPRTSHWPH
jgi:hypothetical protein